MLRIASTSDAERLRAFFHEVGYTEETLRQRLGLWELPSSRLHNLARLQDLTREPSCLNTLLRWFWIGVPEITSAAAQYVPAWFTTLALSAGLLRQDVKNLFSDVMLVPVEGFYIAADQPRKIDSEDSETVLWPNPTSRLLSRFTIRRHSRATLDLGTGCGIQALAAAAHSDAVVATDLNPRAREFALFNSKLNGMENIECLLGDAFAPVDDRKFDLIVSNPPFFVTPSHRYLFCDNPMDLDQMCRQLVREAPKHLNEGGYLQMLCEWAQVHGESWQERISEWFSNTGCDAWVMKGQSADPSQYAQERIREITYLRQHDDKLYSDYMAYYREKDVEAIHTGIVAMRRHQGTNWILMEEVSHSPKEPFGDTILQMFSSHDFLECHASDEQLLAVKPRLSPDARLEQVFKQGETGWQQSSLDLKLVKGFPFSLGVQPLVAEFLSGCTGTRNLKELIAGLAAKVNAPPSQVQKECIEIIRTLIERGFVRW